MSTNIDSLLPKYGPSPRPPLHRTKSTDDQELKEQNDLSQLSKLSKSDPCLETDLSVEATDEDNSVIEDDVLNDDESESEIDEKEEPPFFYTPESGEIKNQPQFSYISESIKIKKAESTVKTASLWEQYILLLLGVPVFILILANLYQGVDPSKPTIDINSLKKSFPTQDSDLWSYFESGVTDVVNYNKPSTFILLYKDDAEKTLGDLLSKLSKFATCNITDCQKEAIELTDQELNSPEILKDYGVLIEEYKEELKKNGVMIIKNLEKVRGRSAQAFHSFCDEFTPLVDKSLFIFTMKVEDLPNSSVIKFVEDFLRSKWNDIKGDIFNALVTRITSIVIVIRP